MNSATISPRSAVRPTTPSWKTVVISIPFATCRRTFAIPRSGLAPVSGVGCSAVGASETMHPNNAARRRN